mgnify:CR=1 FL=1
MGRRRLERLDRENDGLQAQLSDGQRIQCDLVVSAVGLRPRTELADAAKVIARGATRRIDVGQVGDRYFLTTASIGLSVRITKELSGASKRRWGPLAYGVAAIRTLSRVHPFEAEIQYDGGSRRLRAIQIMVGNGRHYGAALTVAEDAEPDDALLDCYAIEAVPWWRLIGLLPALKRGRQGEKADVQAITSRTIRISRRSHAPIGVPKLGG